MEKGSSRMLQEFITELFSFRYDIKYLIGNYDLERLQFFLGGVSHACRKTHNNDMVDYLGQNWMDYVIHAYGEDQGGYGWCNLIKMHAASDQEAISTFFQLLESYTREYYPEIVLPVE